MKLLFDQNLSFNLCDLLADVFPGSAQVRRAGLAQADDRAVWNYAATHDLCWCRLMLISPKWRRCLALHPSSSGRVAAISRLR